MWLLLLFIIDLFKRLSMQGYKVLNTKTFPCFIVDSVYLICLKNEKCWRAMMMKVVLTNPRAFMARNTSCMMSWGLLWERIPATKFGVEIFFNQHAAIFLVILCHLHLPKRSHHSCLWTYSHISKAVCELVYKPEACVK